MIDRDLIKEFPYYATIEIIKLDRSTGINDLMDIRVLSDLADWCMDSVGRDNFHFGWEYPGSDSRKYYRIRFKHGIDADAFTLTWGKYLSNDLA